MTRKECAELHFKLIDLITDCQTDEEFHERLNYAKSVIDNELKHWEEKE